MAGDRLAGSKMSQFLPDPITVEELTALKRVGLSPDISDLPQQSPQSV
jgi:hypothetical protein